MRALAIAAALATPVVAHGQSFVGLGTFQTPAGIGIPLSSDISADGTTVVGQISLSNGPEPAFRWTASTGVQSIGMGLNADAMHPRGVSAEGLMIAGYTSGFPDPNRAWRWSPGSGFVELHPLPGDEGTSASAISDDGTFVAGRSYLAGRGYRVVRWGAGGAIEDIGVYPGHHQSYVWHMAGNGRAIVGWTSGPAGTHPFRWTEKAGMHLIPVGPGFNGGNAFGTSADGSVVVGICYDPTAIYRAFRWSEAGGFQNLGVLTGFEDSQAWRTSADGRVVIGNCSFDTSVHAFIWTPEFGMRDLNEHLPSLGINLDGWVLTHTSGISADGRTIAGQGKHNSVTESWVAVIPCYPDCNEDGPLTVADFGCFQTRFVAGDRYADCNADGVLTPADFGCFQSQFAAGCP